ncbi:sulfotransferase family protein [Streptomyces sp. 846.5]|nr:sulfotransferase [Streptomyces sp. 846.5]TDT97699.1 sulfotransferase family protein [Streptomyces sp. 846.5]
MLNQVPLPQRQELTPHGVELAYPKLVWPIRLLNGLTGPFAERLWPLEPEALKAKARKKAKLSDFGSGLDFDKPLDILCRSLTQELQLSGNGRLGLHSQLVGDLVNRLRLEDLATRRPEIFEAPVPAPLFVTGAMRSGTTFVQRLLARDSRWRMLPMWEVTHPLPDGDLEAPRPNPDPRIRISRIEAGLANKILPEQGTMHELSHEEPEEDNLLLAAGHASSMFEALGLVPEYSRWFTAADHSDGYRYFKRYLQFMQWSRPVGDRWALKAPGHMEMLGPLFSTFGDATVVQTHRDPVTSVISFSNLIAYGARVYFDHPNPHLIGQFSADFVERLLRASIRDRELAGDRIIDIAFHRLIEDPVRELDRVYEVAGREMDDATENAMREYAAAESRSSGRHQYAASDFALDVPELRERFAFYYDRFDVPLDKR